MSTGATLLAEFEARGHRFEVRDGNQIVVIPAPSTEMRELLSSCKAEILEELQRRDWTAGGQICSRCHKIGIVTIGERVCRQCIIGEEWIIDGCPAFTTVVGTDDVVVAKRGLCIACGATWRMHGRPGRSTWRRVRDLDDVQLVAARFVLASAMAIARGAKT